MKKVGRSAMPEWASRVTVGFFQLITILVGYGLATFVLLGYGLITWRWSQVMEIVLDIIEGFQTRGDSEPE